MADRDFKEIILEVITKYQDPDRALSVLDKQLKDLQGDVDGYNNSLDETIKRYKALGAQRVSKHFDMDEIEEYLDQLEEVRKEYEAISKNPISVGKEVRQEAAQRQGRLQQQIADARLAAERIKEFDDDIAAHQEELARQKAIRDKEGGIIKIQAARRVEAVEADIENRRAKQRGDLSLVTGIGRDASRAASGMISAAKGALSFGEQIEGMTGKLTQLVPLLRGAGVLIGVTLASALTAVASSIAAAIAALVGMATSFLVTLAPAVAVVLGFFARLAAVLKAVSAINKANDAEQLAKQQEAYARALEQVHDATIRVRDAEEASADARANLATATKQAHENFARALQDEADAQREAAEASQNVKDATVDAYDEMAEAADRFRDAILGVEDAKLGIRQASLDLREANRELEEFRSGAVRAGSELDNAFQKFGGVNFDSSALKKALLEARQRGDIDAEAADELEQRLINVEKAKLNEKKATNDLRDANQELTRARRKDQEFQKDGIAASDTYIGALDRQREALRKLKEAEQDAADARKRGWQNDPGLIGAQRAARDAEQRVTEAERNLREMRKTADTASPSKAAEEAQDALKLLSPAEQGFARMLVGVRDGFMEIIRAGTDPLFIALTNILPLLERMADKVKDLFGAIGGSLATSLETIVGLLSGPEWTAWADRMIPVAENLIGIVTGRLAYSFLTLVANVSEMFAPQVVQGLSLVTDLMDRISAATEHGGKSGGLAQDLYNAFTTIWDLLVSIGDLIFSLFSAGGGAAAGGFLTYITEFIQGLADWMKSPDGMARVQQFFEDTMPLAESIFKFLWNLGSTFLKVFEFFAPIITDTVEGFNFLLTLLQPVLDVLLLIPAPIRRIIGFFLPFIGLLRGGIGAIVIGFEKLPKIISGAVKLIGVPLAVFRSAIRLVGAAVGPVVDFFRDLFNKVKTWVTSAKDHIGDLMGKVMRLFSVKRWKDLGIKAFQALIDGIASLGESIYNTMKGIFDTLWETLKGPFDSFLAYIEEGFARVVNLLIDGVNTVIRGVNKLPNFGPVGVPEIGEIAKMKVPGEKLSKALKKPPAAGLAGQAAAKGDVNIGEIKVFGPKGSDYPDPRASAVALGRELKRRGGK